jgi:hypothetical protein
MEMQVWKKGLISNEIEKDLQIRYKRNIETNGRYKSEGLLRTGQLPF